MNETGANATEGLRAAKIWGYRDSWRADGGRTDGGVDDGTSGEIHPQLARYKGW